MHDQLRTSFESDDYIGGSVPTAERRHPLTMGLLWVTMCTGFANVMVGFQWHKAGFTLSQVLLSSLVSVAIVVAYTLPASYIGCQSGLTWANLSQRVFGRLGSYFASFNLMWVNIGWYALNAMFCGETLRGLFQLPWAMTSLGAVLALVMAVNNFFGFSGVANYARWIAAPVLVAWVGYTFIKAVSLSSPALLFEPSSQPMAIAITQVSTLVIGFCCWGNEPDYWRFGKKSLWYSFLPILGAVAIGGFFFPVAGWLLAQATGVSEYAQAAVLMDKFAFGGIPLIAALVLFIVYLAGNDANLYGSVNALQNICGFKRKYLVAVLTLACIAAVFWLSGIKNKFEAVASLSSIFIPSVTIIILAEWFLLRRLSHPLADYFHIDTTYKESVPAVRWPAAIALICGCLVGVATSGVIPGLAHWQIGICALQAWLTCFAVYLVLRIVESWKPDATDNLVKTQNAVRASDSLPPQI
jgi:purine-cytosine permease-like protein